MINGARMKIATELNLMAAGEEQHAQRIRDRMGARGEATAKECASLADEARASAMAMVLAAVCPDPLPA